MRYVLATAAALIVVATLISVAFAAPRLRTSASKTTQRRPTGIYTRPSGRGHWATAHATTSKTNITVRRKK